MALKWHFITPGKLASNPYIHLILDVRRPKEYNDSHILNSHNYPLYIFHTHSLGKISETLSGWGLDLGLNNFNTKRSVVFHCRLSLVRGPDALDILSKKIELESVDDRWDKISFWLLSGGWKSWEIFANVKENC